MAKNDIPAGPYGADALVRAVLSGDEAAVHAILGTPGNVFDLGGLKQEALKENPGLMREVLGGQGGPLTDKVTGEINNYFSSLPVETVRAVQTSLGQHPDFYNMLDAGQRQQLQDAFDHLPPAQAATAAPTAAPTPPASVPVTDSTLDFIKQREGFTPTAYKDGDHYSIGYGTYATPAEIRSGAAISEAEASRRLAQEVGQAANYVDSITKVPLADNVRTALISMAYNVGQFGPGLTAAVQSGDVNSITEMMGKYRTAQDPSQSAGVSNRRDAEIALAKTQGVPAPTRVAYAPTTPVSPAAAAVTAVAKGQSPPVAPSAKPPLPTVRPADLTPIADAIDNGRRIGKGSSGETVRELQHFLNLQGATDDRGKPLKEDGIFGPLTRQAVKDYQSTHPELVKDGVVGPRTLAAMEQDQQKMAQAAAERPYNNLDRPALLTQTAVTDPVTQAIQQEADRFARLGPTAAAMMGTPAVDIYSPPAIYAHQIGSEVGSYLNMPPPPAAQGSPTAQYGGFRLYPTEATGATGAERQAVNALTLPLQDQPTDISRAMMGYGTGSGSLGSGVNVSHGEIVYNAISAAARQMMFGTPPDERTAATGDLATTEQQPGGGFIPPTLPAALPVAGIGTTADGGYDVDGVHVPPEGTIAPPADDNLIPPVDATPIVGGTGGGGNSTLNDILANHNPADIVPALSSQDSNTLFDPQPVDQYSYDPLADQQQVDQQPVDQYSYDPLA